MARKILFSKVKMLEKIKEFIEIKGIDSLTARDLYDYIGCSTQPLFKNFESMDGLKRSLKEYLHDYYEEYIHEMINKDDYLFTISYAYA